MAKLRTIVLSLLLVQTLVGLSSAFILEETKNEKTINSGDVTYKTTIRGPALNNDVNACNLAPALVAEIQGYKNTALKIINEVTSGSFKGQTFANLARFVDVHGGRLSGSAELENSIDYMMDLMTVYGFDNVHGEEVVVPHYYRGEEKAELLEPRKQNLAILGLVPTVGTPPEGVTGQVLVVTSFDDLKAKADQAKGKIVVFNQDWVSYGTSVAYRSGGAVAAAEVGAIAALVRSVTPFSLDTPHTGGFDYQEGIPEIPVASITVEDAKMLNRMQDFNDNITIHLTLLNYNLPPTTSRNVFGQLTGTTIPEEYVGVSGHIDSWEGQGAMDDGGGVFISVEALALLKHLNLIPKRTLQAILWTSEEVGLIGVDSYAINNKAFLQNFSAVFESDGGTFHPLGLDFAGSEAAGCIVEEALKLLDSINATQYVRYDRVGSDISRLIAEGVPGLSLALVDNNYFWYHHTKADTMEIQNPDEMDLCTAVWAVVSYVIADLSVKLPRDPPAP